MYVDVVRVHLQEVLQLTIEAIYVAHYVISGLLIQHLGSAIRGQYLDYDIVE